MKNFSKLIGIGALALAGAALCTPAFATNVGGYNVVASADSLISSTGDFDTSGGSLASVLLDNDPGTYAFSFSPDASVTLGFSSGIENKAGSDFVLFELGTPDTFDVTINGFTIAGLSQSTGYEAGGYDLLAYDFDLSDFGLAAGASITSLTIGLSTPNVANGTVPSLSFAGVLNAGLVSSAPEPSIWMLMIAGVAMIGGALRLGRKRSVGSLSVA